MKLYKIFFLCLGLLLLPGCYSDFQKGCIAHKNKDYSTAIKYYKKATSQGNAQAQNNLANMYNLGKGVKKDYDEAIALYKRILLALS